MLFCDIKHIMSDFLCHYMRENSFNHTPVLINALLFWGGNKQHTINCFALPSGNRDEDSGWRTFNYQICPLLNDLNCIHYHVSF